PDGRWIWSCVRVASRWRSGAEGNPDNGPAGKRPVRRVGNGNILVSWREEHDSAGERVHTIVSIVAYRKRVVRGQQHSGLLVAGGEADGALVVRVRVAVGVEGRDNHVEGRARGDCRRSGDEKMVSRRRDYHDRGAALDGAAGCVLRLQGLH